MDRRIESLLRKAAHLRHAAAATFWLDYREKMLDVARELEARATRLEQEPERSSGDLPGSDHDTKR